MTRSVTSINKLDQLVPVRLQLTLGTDLFILNMFLCVKSLERIFSKIRKKEEKKTPWKRLGLQTNIKRSKQHSSARCYNLLATTFRGKKFDKVKGKKTYRSFKQQDKQGLNVTVSNLSPTASCKTYLLLAFIDTSRMKEY